MEEEKILVGDKETTLEVLSEQIAKGLLKVIKDTGKWEKFNLKLEFHGRKDGDQVHIASVVLSSNEDPPKKVSKKKQKENPEKFLDELNKL